MSFTIISYFIFLIILTELLTELVIKSQIFKPLRNWIKGWGSWFAELFSCGYCFSVWAAFFVVIVGGLSVPITEHNLLNTVLTSLVVHRLSNILHNIIDKWTDKYYDMRFVNSEKE